MLAVIATALTAWQEPTEASCDLPVGVTFEGGRYLGVGTRGGAERGVRLGVGEEFSCFTPSPTVVVFSVRGRDPKGAILVEPYGLMERNHQLDRAQ
jgi:hypothetical protein